MTDDPLFDGGEDAELDRLSALLSPLKTEAPPPPLPSQAPLWRSPVFQALAAALVVAVGAVVISAGSDDEEGGLVLVAPGGDEGATGAAVVAEDEGSRGLTADGVRALEDDADAAAGTSAESGDGADAGPDGVLDEFGNDRNSGDAPFELPGRPIRSWDRSSGDGARQITESLEGNAHYPQISPSGKGIAFEVNYPAERRTELWAGGLVDDQLTNPQLLLHDLQGTGFGVGKRITHMFGWAPEESEYGFAYTVNNADGQQQIYIDGWPDLLADGVNKEPTWDPTSPRFVFTSNRTGNGDLYLWDDGAELQLTFDETHAELYPSWAPAGDKVTFVRAGKGESQVMVLDINLYRSRMLVNFPSHDATRPSFSPNGDKVAFLSNKGQDSVMKFGLWVVDAKPGSTPRQIADRVKIPSKGSARWTPDGRGVIAVIDDPDLGDPIAIVPIDGSGPRTLDTGTVKNRDPFLHVDGDRWLLAFTSQGPEARDERTWYSLYLYEIPH